jgi:hypothetical protein
VYIVKEQANVQVASNYGPKSESKTSKPKKTASVEETSVVGGNEEEQNVGED